MDHFRAVVITLNKKANVGLVTALVALSTAGGEQIFSLVVFSCPCNDGNRLYGAVSFFVPALVLLALGYILNRDTWKLVTGLALRKTNLKDTLNTVAMYLIVSNTAWIAPLCWIAVALLGGNYYVCALAGENVPRHYQDHLLCSNMSRSRCQEEHYKFPCRGKSTAVPQAEIDDILATLRAESQILGWLYIAIIILFHLLMTCAARCCSRISDQQLRFRRLYAEQESGLLECYAAEHAKKLAKRNLDSFFFVQTPEPTFTTPSSRDWEEISGFNHFDYELAMPLTATVIDDDHDYYSVIHQYVEMERGSAGTATSESAL